MKLLRDEWIVAVNDVIAALVRAAGCHQLTVSYSDEPETWEKLAEAHRETANRLKQIVKDAEDIPNEPSEESLLAMRAATQLKASLADDPAGEAIADALEAERELVDAAETARDHDLPDQAAEAVEQALARARETIATHKEAAAAR